MAAARETNMCQPDSGTRPQGRASRSPRFRSSNERRFSGIPRFPIIKCMIYLSVCANEPASRRASCGARKRSNGNGSNSNTPRKIDPLYSTATLRKATRVTFERQDDAMNYKMTVKAKVSRRFRGSLESEER